MTGITFKRITPEESRIYADGMIIGEVYRHDDILKPGRTTTSCICPRTTVVRTVSTTAAGSARRPRASA